MNQIEDKYFKTNTIFLGDRSELYNIVKEGVKQYVITSQVFNIQEPIFFEIQKLNISVDDVRRMISFVQMGSEGQKIVMLSSFYWTDEAQNALLKVLEESPPNTKIFLFGLSERNFLSTVLSRVQKLNFNKANKYFSLAKEILKLHPNERLEKSQVKKILSQKIVDFDYEKNKENEKKDRETHILFLFAIIASIKEQLAITPNNKFFFEQLQIISQQAESEGASPHLFIEWLLLTAPQI